MFLTEERMRSRAAVAIAATASLGGSASRVLEEAAVEHLAGKESFDVFLSHSSAEPEDILLGVFETLRGAGLSVYVDKYSDPQLSPDSVTRDTAELLRERMRASSSLLYVSSKHSTKSLWMPWELGFFDGYNGKVGIVPVTEAQNGPLNGQEYVLLYPYVKECLIKGTTRRALWIFESPKCYAKLIPWIMGEEQICARQ